MADRPRSTSPHRSRTAPAVVGLVVLACAACGVPRTESVAGPALASPVATARPRATSAEPTVPVTSASGSPSGSRSGSPSGAPSGAPSTVVPTETASTSVTASATSTATATGVDLQADTISFGPPTRSVRFSRPADWTESRVTTSDGVRVRNRTIYRSPDGGLSLTVEISPATTTNPLAAAFGAQAARSAQGTPGYRTIRVQAGPGGGATWEFLSTLGGVARHSVDWFRTVGSTDLAVFITGAASDWDAAHEIWGQVVGSVGAGEEPPGYAGPTAPADPASPPSSPPLPTGSPTPTVAPSDGTTAAPGPTPRPGRTIDPGKTKGPGKTKEPQGG